MMHYQVDYVLCATFEWVLSQLTCLQDSLFSIFGSVLYIASGSVALDYHSHLPDVSWGQSDTTHAGLALGALCLCTGLYLLDWDLLDYVILHFVLKLSIAVYVQFIKFYHPYLMLIRIRHDDRCDISHCQIWKKSKVEYIGFQLWYLLSYFLIDTIRHI